MSLRLHNAHNAIEDVIVTSAGLNIHPQDLEAVLRRQPGLRDSLIVAYDSSAGPAPAAVLIADAEQGDDLLERAVDKANGELAPFQQIRYWLRWPQPEFPRTSTGKVLRRVVQSWAQQSLAAGGAAVESPSDPLLLVLRRLGAANQEISARDRLIEDLPKYFAVDGDIVMSHILAVLSSVFPDGEDFFVRSVTAGRGDVRDTRLAADVEGFIGQE